MKLYGMDAWKKPAPADEGRDGLSWDGAAPWKGWTAWHRMGWDGMGKSPCRWCQLGGNGDATSFQNVHLPTSVGQGVSLFLFQGKKRAFSPYPFLSPLQSHLQSLILGCSQLWGDSERTQWWGTVLGSFSMGSFTSTFHEVDISKGRDECWHGRDGPKACCILSVQTESPHCWLGLA